MSLGGWGIASPTVFSLMLIMVAQGVVSVVNYTILNKVFTMMPRAICYIGVCLLTLLLSMNTYAAPLAGSFITNQASSSFVDSRSGLSSNLSSNTVRAQVLPFPSVQLTAPQNIHHSPGTTAYLFHTLTNTGNVTTDYTLSATNQLNDSYDLNNLRVIQDNNGNGIPDAGEPVLTATTPITLAVGASAAFIVSGIVPSTVGLNVYSHVQLTATAVGTALTVNNLDTVLTQNGATLSLSKTVDNANAQRNDVLTYTITMRNTGIDAAAGRTITVDGYTQQSVLIYDQVPANTSFSHFVAAAGGQMLYHRFGAAAHVYTSTPPALLSSIDAVAVAYASVPANTARTMQFAVTVNQNASGAVDNTAQAYYFNRVSTSVDQQPSNTVQTSVALVPPSIAYYSNNQYQRVTPATILGQPLFLQADAASCNLDALVAETRTIIIDSALTGDSEQFVLTETGPNTGIFRLSNGVGIPTQDANRVTVVLNNGTIETLTNDSLTASMNGCGTVSVVTNILVDPLGCMFDSQTGAPVVGSTVTLIDVTGAGNGGNAGGSATVFAADGVTPVAATQVTDSYGCYQFPTVAPSTYQLQVQPPVGYTAPSTVPVGQLPAGHTIVGDPVNGGASYGGTFIVSVTTGAVTIDIPMDSYTAAVAASGVVNVYKQVSAAAAVAGGSLTYTLTATNTGLGNAPAIALNVDGAAASMVLVRDVIPANTTFTGISNAATATVLYHSSGAAVDQYTTVAPVPLNKVDAIAFGFASFPPTSNVTMAFTVTINGNATGNIPNTAAGLFLDVYGNVTNQASNAVATATATTAPTIQYYTDSTYGRIAPAIGMGMPLFIQASASSCNIDPLVAEQHVVTITSSLTGDQEAVLFQETGPNTGLFQIATSPYNMPTRDGALFPAINNNGIVEVLNLDTLTAAITGCGVAITAQTTILVDPGGTVFDSSTGAPIPNVSVTLIDNATGLPANVLQFDAYTVAPSTVLTDAYGFFQFPLVAPGVYHLQITAVPAGYTYPSTVPLAQLPPQYTILGNPNTVATSGSYGGTFSVTPAAGPVVLDVPMDPQPLVGLFTQKTVAQSTVELGAYVDYTVSVKNTLTVSIANINLIDVLPHGFSFMPGTARRDGVVVANPAGGRGPTLTFPIGVLAAGTTTVFTYRARVGPGSLQGDAINRAWAQSPVQISNTALAGVTIVPGMLGDQAYLFGKVYLDCDSSRMQGEEEIGIPGVRLYLEDGTFAITDVEGKWSLYGLNPRTHVVKVDRTTLPKHSELINLSNRHGGDPNSRFVDLKKGDWHRADFAVSNCTEALRAEVYERRDQGEVLVSELQRNIHQTGIHAATQQNRSTIASGMITPRSPVAGIEDSTVAQGLNGANSNLPEAPDRTVMQTPIEKRMPLMNNTFGFVDMHDGDVLPYHQANVLIKGMAQNAFQLYINGTAIAAKKIGKKSTLPSKQLQVWEYIGMEFHAGDNTLRAVVKDAFGNIRGDETIHVKVPGDTAQVTMTVPESADADGHSEVTVMVKLLDAAGLPVTVRTPLTLQASLGRWKAKDVNPVEPGVQVFMQGGKQEFILIAPQETGKAIIKVNSGILNATSQLAFLPPLRPMIAVGVIEGRVQLNSFNLKNIMPVRQRDGFEQQLRLMSSSNGKRESGARAAVFLKGRVLGSYLLTAAYDSDKQTKGRLFRDIQPDAYYPIYGDSAVKGFDAQSTTRLYVRVDHDRSWLLYGDFTTQGDGEDMRKLSLYNRTMTGVKHHYENTVVSVDSFATRDVSRQVVEELVANGTSGPYYLASTAMLLNSEKLEVLTRDRNQPSVILQATPLQRFTDYQIEALTGRIILAAPVPSLDANLNPKSIRVTYELDQGGQKFWTGGATATVKVGDHLRVGATHVDDRNPLNRSRLNGAHAQLKWGEAVTATVEAARSKDQANGKGNARRAEVQFKKGSAQGRVYAANTDVAFNNVSAYLNKGREEAGAEVSGQVTAKTGVKAQVIHTKDKATGAQRRGAEASVNQQLGDWVKAEVGYRQSADSQQGAAVAGAVAGPRTQRSARVKLSTQVPGLTELGIYGEFERDLNNGAQRRAAVGGDYQIANQGKVYARHEFLTSNSGAFGLNNSQNNASTVFGIDTSYMEDGKLFSEYRARDAISGREDQASIGLRNGWALGEGLRLSTTLERIRVLNGPGTANSTTVSGGLEYTADPLLKASGRLELHFGTAENSVLSTMGFARKLDLDWSLLAKNTYSRRLNRLTAGVLTDNRLQLGLAYRQVLRNHVHWLGMYEFAQKRDTTAGTSTQSHLLSTHVNVQPVQALTLTGRYAIKWLNDNLNGMKFNYGIQVASGRAMVDITERWDAGLIGSTMYSNGFTTRQGGIGVETGYMVQANLWLSVGYNVFGFRDREGLANQYTDQGGFVRLRYKFDENLFDRKDEGQ